jgi:hypothetical protein
MAPLTSKTLEPIRPGYGRLSKEEFTRRLVRGKNWQEEVHQSNVKRIREKIATSKADGTSL